jgi:hypothetical protein
MLVRDKVTVKPAGEPVAERVTVPVKPLSGATVIVEVAVEPGRMKRDVGLAARMKSGVLIET